MMHRSLALVVLAVGVVALVLAPVTFDVAIQPAPGIAGSGQVYTCPKGAQFSLESGRRPDGLPQTLVFREPGHQLAAKVSPAGVQLLEHPPETMTYEALLEKYPSPCDYLERVRT